MEEVKKKVFNWKRLLIIGTIILLVLAMTPLFWRNMIIDAKLDDVVPYINIVNQEDYSDSKLEVVVESKYWQDYVDEKIELKDFKYDNIERIEYCGSSGKKTEYDSSIDEQNGRMMIYLKKTGYDELKKAIAKLRTLKFVDYVTTVLEY